MLNVMDLFRLSCFLTAVSIGLNAFGHHALKKVLETTALGTYEVAVKYLVWGSLWMLVLTRPKAPLGGWPVWMILCSLGLFSGSLLLYLLFPIKGLVYLTPLGGLGLMVGFVSLGVVSKSE